MLGPVACLVLEGIILGLDRYLESERGQKDVLELGLVGKPVFYHWGAWMQSRGIVPILRGGLTEDGTSPYR